jgi:hypothetical protein
MATWIDVMALARSLRDKRATPEGLNGRDAEDLLTLLFDFHDRAVVSTPPPDEAARRPRAGT